MTEENCQGGKLLRINNDTSLCLKEIDHVQMCTQSCVLCIYCLGQAEVTQQCDASITQNVQLCSVARPKSELKCCQFSPFSQVFPQDRKSI